MSMESNKLSNANDTRSRMSLHQVKKVRGGESMKSQKEREKRGRERQLLSLCPSNAAQHPFSAASTLGTSRVGKGKADGVRYAGPEMAYTEKKAIREIWEDATHEELPHRHDPFGQRSLACLIPRSHSFRAALAIVGRAVDICESDAAGRLGDVCGSSWKRLRRDVPKTSRGAAECFAATLYALSRNALWRGGAAPRRDYTQRSTRTRRILAHMPRHA
ncbi:hypothetical protein MRX96_009464 [Rhipicephalus microplus]